MLVGQFKIFFTNNVCEILIVQVFQVYTVKLLEHMGYLFVGPQGNVNIVNGLINNDLILIFLKFV